MFALLTAALLGAVDHTGSSAKADPLGRGAWMLDPSEDAVLLVTPRAGVERFDACAWPSQLVVDGRGAAYVSCRQSGEVRRLVSGEAAEVWQVGTEPAGLALDESARRLYVGLVTERAVVMLDADSGEELGRAFLDAEPTAVGLYPGGLVVGSRKSDVVRIYPRGLDAAPSERKLRSPSLDPTIAVSVSAELFVPESSRLIIVAPLAEVGNIDQQTYYGSTRGSPVTQDLFVLDDHLQLKRLRNVVLPDVSAALVFEGALLMASRGLGGVVSVPLRAGMIEMAWDLPTGTLGVADDGSRWFAINDVSREVLVRPRAVVQPIARQRLYGAGTLMPEPPGEPRNQERIALGGGGDAELARGRALFHMASNYRISAAPLACASCHREGRDDGRTWLGQQSMRQTPMLAGRDIAHTAPYGWNGRYPRLEDYIQFTIGERMLGVGLPKKDLAALARYVREGLRPVTKPEPAAERRDEVRRGRVVFHADATGCSSCHGAMDAFTDGAVHDVGSIGAAERSGWFKGQALRGLLTAPKPSVTVQSFGDLIAADQLRKQQEFGSPAQPQRQASRRPPPPPPAPLPLPVWLRKYETPSLKQLALSAPYLHDGSAKTIDGVLVRLGDHMGTVSTLTSRERNDLVAYLETL